jgi:hypothetical protein
MDVQVSITPASVNLGEPVTIIYSSTGFADTVLTIDNIPNPIDLGAGDVSGSIKILPVIAGGFNVEIKGSGVPDAANDYLPELTRTSFCQVN